MIIFNLSIFRFSPPPSPPRRRRLPPRSLLPSLARRHLVLNGSCNCFFWMDKVQWETDVIHV